MKVTVPKERNQGHKCLSSVSNLKNSLLQQMTTGYAGLTASQTWAVVPLVITKDVIRTHNELAEKYFLDLGTYLLAWFLSCFYRLGNHGHRILRCTSYLMSLLYWHRIMLFPTLCVFLRKYMIYKGNKLDRGPKHHRKVMEQPIATNYTAQQTEDMGAWSWKSCTGWRTLQPFSRNQVTSSIHLRCETPDISWAFDLSQNQV